VVDLAVVAAVLAAMRYDAFGNKVAQATAGTFIDVVGYRGERLDAVTGNIYLRRRDYTPPTGRFTSLDPFEGLRVRPITLHQYLYAGSNPTTYSDPSGQFLVTLAFAGISVMTGLRVHKASATFIAGRTILWTLARLAVSGLAGYVSFRTLRWATNWLFELTGRVRKPTPQEAEFYAFIFISATGNRFRGIDLASALQGANLFNGSGFASEALLWGPSTAAFLAHHWWNAGAITLGNDIFFSSNIGGVPAANTGDAVLGHELFHYAQNLEAWTYDGWLLSYLANSASAVLTTRGGGYRGNRYEREAHAVESTIDDAVRRHPTLFADVNTRNIPPGAAAFIAARYQANKAREDALFG
jgi:RHS repeat-associated protein